MARSFAALSRAFLRAEAAREAAVLDYVETLRLYRRLRSDRTRREAYPYVLEAYRDLVHATEVRNTAAARAEAAKQVREIRPAVRAAGTLSEGTEFEMTATTKGGTPKAEGSSWQRDPRVLHLKIRLVLDRAMTAARARALLDRAISSDRGQVPPGIQVYPIDWAKGRMEGTEEDIAHALRDFYGAMIHGGTRLRFERVVE